MNLQLTHLESQLLQNLRNHGIRLGIFWPGLDALVRKSFVSMISPNHETMESLLSRMNRTGRPGLLIELTNSILNKLRIPEDKR